MNRETKFRGKRKDNGDWVYGYLLKSASTFIAVDGGLVDGHFKLHEVDPGTVGQYTGFKRNKEIFEGDICDTNTRWGKGVVKFESGMFKINGLSLCTFVGRTQVIGNIWDNPSLLEATP